MTLLDENERHMVVVRIYQQIGRYPNYYRIPPHGHHTAYKEEIWSTWCPQHFPSLEVLQKIHTIMRSSQDVMAKVYIPPPDHDVEMQQVFEIHTKRWEHP